MPEHLKIVAAGHYPEYRGDPSIDTVRTQETTMSQLVNKMQDMIKDVCAMEEEIQVLVDKLATAENRIGKLLRDKGEFGHGCKVESGFFGTSLELGSEPAKLRVLFFWHRGYPAIQIQSGPAQDVLLRAALVDDKFKNLPRTQCNDAAPWKIVRSHQDREPDGPPGGQCCDKANAPGFEAGCCSQDREPDGPPRCQCFERTRSVGFQTVYDCPRCRSETWYKAVAVPQNSSFGPVIKDRKT